MRLVALYADEIADDLNKRKKKFKSKQSIY